MCCRDAAYPRKGRNDMMKYGIFDETDGHVVNESEAYGETGDYGNIDDPCCYLGDIAEAEKIAARLAEGTGHKFSLRM